MAAAVRPLSPVGPQLTPEQEDRGWAVMEAFDAARKSGDEHAELDAIGDFLDWQFSVGLMTRERWRELTAPFLLDAIARADEMPAGRELLQRLRDEALEAVNGDDYSERTAGALFILCVDGVQNPRLHAARRAEERRARADWTCALRSIETRTDLACLLLWTHAWGDEADADHDVPRVNDAREAWTAARAAKRKAQGLLQHMGQAVDGEREYHMRTRQLGADHD